MHRSKITGNPPLTAHWVGYDQDSTHAYRIYWAGQNKISVERDVQFTVGTSTISIPSSSPVPPVPALTAPPIALTPSIAPASSTPTQATSTPQQPPAATNSREEEIEVKDKLIDTPPLPAPRSKRSKPSQATQPTRQSEHIYKPSQYARKLASGEGTTDGGMQGLLGHHLDFDDDSALTELLAEIDALPEEEECKDSNGTFLAEVEEAIAAVVQEAKGDPRSLKEAQSCSNWPCWKEAMDRKIHSLEQAGTWETVPCLKDKNVVGCKWVC